MFRNLLLTLLMLAWVTFAFAEVGELYRPWRRPVRHKSERYVAIQQVDPQGFGVLLENGANARFLSLAVRNRVKLWNAGDVLSVFYSEDGHIASIYHPPTNVIVYP